MNILHVVNIPFVIPYFLGKQLNFFSEKGYNEFIVCCDSEELQKFSEIYNFNYKPVEILRKISLSKDIRAIISTTKYIREIKADVVVGHTPKGALIAMMSAYLARVPIRIYFRHGLVYETSKGFKRKLLIIIDKFASKLATRIVCVSPSVAARSVADKLNPISKQAVLFKGTCNGIDTNRFSKGAIDPSRLQIIRENNGIREGDFIIGFTGRLVRDKGIIELVEAYKTVHEKYTNARLLLVGMLEERDALPEHVVKSINEDENIIKTGYVDNGSIEYYYAMMDVFVLPSYREGFPTSVLEASSMELPVITTRATGCVDSIIEGETGIFVNHHEDELRDAILTLYADKPERVRLGRSGRNYVIDNYEQSIVWKEIEKLYGE